jgi:putative selenium metabolism protein SsnA
MLIHNAKLITWGESNEILENYALLIEGDRIVDMGPSADLLAQNLEDERIDAEGQFVMPGNICAHTHFYGAFARGIAIPGAAPRDFPEILRKLWWPLDKSLTEEDIKYSALISLVDAVKHGTTTLVDHHASPNFIEGSLDSIADTVDQAGLRAVLCYEVTDRDGEEKSRAGIDENLRFIDRCRNDTFAEGRIKATFGLHASLTLSDETLEACRQAAGEHKGFHIHVAEHEADEDDSLSKSGLRVVHRLAKHEILGPETIVAHAVHVDQSEIDRLASTETWVTHQPRSNMNNAVGAANIEALRASGVRVALGNDGFSNTMWAEWKAAYLLQKVANRDPRKLSGGELVEIAIDNNASLAAQFFDEALIGQLAIEAYADLIFVDYHPPTPLSAGNLPWHILFGFHESMITTTIVAGRLLMRDRKLLTLDEEQITARSRELAIKVWHRYQSFVPKG